jgi:hypothetical protein
LPDRLNTLERFLSLGEAASSSTSVTVVANLKEGDEPRHVNDVRTEYLTQTELDEIITRFREAGYYSEAFTDEVEFIRWLIAEGRNSEYQSHTIYSTAQQGFSPGRHALVPAAASLAGLTLLTSDPYFDCLSHHKFHAYSLLRAAGLSVPLERDGLTRASRTMTFA